MIFYLKKEKNQNHDVIHENMRNEEFCDFLQISNETEETSTSNWKRKIVNSGTRLNWMHIRLKFSQAEEENTESSETQ